ncbi:MAG: phospholipase D-like domain-containing protein [Alphaproteobacteria bacterium]|nr:phospholipase D-like domain-containing protein [Alphaproteobacteria bacterium]
MFVRKWSIFILTMLISFPAWGGEGKILAIFFTPGNECETEIIRKINQAQKIDIAVYAINNDNIVKALIEGYHQGKEIRIVTDRVQSKGKWSKVSELSQSGIALQTNRRHKIEHNKFAVFDEEEVVSGSFNWTNPASLKNSENCIFFTDPQKNFQSRFQYLWNFYKPTEKARAEPHQKSPAIARL